MDDNGMNRRVCFQGRDCKVVYAHLYSGDHYDIWLQDIKTEKFTDVCSVNIPGLPLDERRRLVREQYVELLAEAGIVQPTGEVVDTERHGRLHKCDVPVRERISFLEQGHSPAKTGEHHASIQIERDAAERDLGDEVER